MTALNSIRVGAVSYLNTKPLVHELTESAPQVELTFDLPSRLADSLAAGRLDVALIPSIEFFQNPHYTIVSDACIACRGPVLSVKLLSRVPPAKISTLALDEGSRTSAALVQILLKQQYNVTPQLQTLPIGNSFLDSPTDAVLVIGDRAIHTGNEQFPICWDLGARWREWSGLPFVFAMWTARAGLDLGGLDIALSQARDAGLSALRQIAHREGPPLGMTPAACYGYLHDNLHFKLGEAEQRGLELYYQHASALGLAPAGLELPFRVYT